MTSLWLVDMTGILTLAGAPPPQCPLSNNCCPPLEPTPCRTVLTADGSPALGPDRPTSGVCGAPIRQAALDFVRAARSIIDNRQLGLTLIGVGGVSCGQHVADMLAAGADFVQSATGMMWNPLLAHEYHSQCCQQQHQQQQQMVGGGSAVLQGQNQAVQLGCVMGGAGQQLATAGSPIIKSAA